MRVRFALSSSLLRCLFILLLLMGIAFGHPALAQAVDATPRVRSNVKVLPSMATRGLNAAGRTLQATPHSLILAGRVSTYKVGDVLVGGEGEGFLRKVLSVRSDGGRTLLQTAPAALTDVFRQAHIGLHKRLGRDDFAAVTPLYPGVSVGEEDPSRQLNGVTHFSAIPVDFARVKFEVADGGTKGEVELNGSATFAPSLDFDLQISDGLIPSVTSARCISSMESTLSVSVLASVKVRVLEWGKRILNLEGETIKVLVGPIPVVFKPIFHVDAKIEGSIEKQGA